MANIRVNMKKRILYIASTLEKTGPTNQLLDIIKNIDFNRFDITLITLSPEPANSLFKEFSQVKINIHQLKLTRIAYLISAKIKISSIIKTIQPHLIHSHGIRADLISSILRNDIPHISTIHNVPDLDYAMTYGFFYGKILSSIHTRIMKRTSLCIAVSNTVLSSLKEKNIINIKSIPNGIDSKKFHPVSMSEKNLIRQDLNLPQDKTIWICSGKLNQRKNPIFTIQAWKNKKPHEDNILIFIGDGDLKAKCLVEIGESDNIRLLGKVENVEKYLQASDYYISSSIAEGLPLSVLEAMSCGLPPLLSDITPHKEIVLEYDIGVDFTYQSNDKQDFHKKIDYILSLDHLVISNKFSDLIKKNFSSQKMSETYQSTYLRTIK